MKCRWNKFHWWPYILEIFEARARRRIEFNKICMRSVVMMMMPMPMMMWLVWEMKNYPIRMNCDAIRRRQTSESLLLCSMWSTCWQIMAIIDFWLDNVCLSFHVPHTHTHIIRIPSFRFAFILFRLGYGSIATACLELFAHTYTHWLNRFCQNEIQWNDFCWRNKMSPHSNIHRTQTQWNSFVTDCFVFDMRLIEFHSWRCIYTLYTSGYVLTMSEWYIVVPALRVRCREPKQYTPCDA